MDKKIEEIISRAWEGKAPTYEEVVEMLECDEASPEATAIRGAADGIQREKTGNAATIWGQIGIEVYPCEADCQFCSFGKSHTCFTDHVVMPVDEVVRRAVEFAKGGDLYGLYLMTMNTFDEDHYLECVKAVREAVGPDVDLLVEVHRRLSPYHAIHFSERIQEYNPFWIEEPCLADNIDLIAQAHAGIKAPVVTGETLYNKEAFIPVFEKHAAEIINPDICVSGIKVMSEISAMAEPYSVLMSPHNFNSNAVGLAAMIHLSASIPNFLIGEMFLTVDEASREIMVEPFEIKNGYVALPTKPGLGIDIDMDKLSQRPYKFFERKFPFKGACDYRDEFPKEGM